MAFISIIRKSAFSLAPMASRVVRSQRNYHSALFASRSHAYIAQKHSLVRYLIPTLHYSTAPKKHSSEESLLGIIESEIKCAMETDDHDQVEGIPSGFPFEIQDNPGMQTVTLKRIYQGEDIQVEVHMPDLVTGDNDDDDADDDNEKANQSSIPLIVNVSKRGGPALEFSCTAYPDEIAIDSLVVKNPENSEDQIAYEGPDFNDLDENLQKAFHKYLEIRGIKPSTTNFLHEYMINKDSKEYLLWLKKVKKFVEA